MLSATAFHWLDPDVRMAKAADALRPGGALAVVSTHHVAGGTDPFFVDVRRCYEQFAPGTPPGLRLPAAGSVPKDSEEFDRSGRFEAVRFHRHEWETTYRTAEFIDLLMTYSGHRTMPADLRRGLHTSIADLIDTGHGGQVTQRYLTQLAIARVRASRGAGTAGRGSPRG